MKSKLLCLAFLLGALTAPVSAHADTTADCGRFYLKYDEKTKEMKCVNGRRAAAVTSQSLKVVARQVAQTVRTLQKVVDGAESILRTQELKQEVEQRVRQLINEVRQRTRELQQQNEKIAQAQQSRTQNLDSQQRQLLQTQMQLSRELQQTQLSLSQQLLSTQRP